jgi:DNA-binding Lrp family transcriptional regulator
MLPETWTTRDLPLLTIALRRADDGLMPIEFEEFAEEAGLELRQVKVGIQALESDGFLDAYFASMDSGMVTVVHSTARYKLETWPSPESITDRVVRALAQAAEVEPDPKRAKWLRQMGEGASTFARDVFVETVAGVFRQHTGLGG